MSLLKIVLYVFVFVSSISWARCFETVGNLAKKDGSYFVIATGQYFLKIKVQDGELPQYSPGVTLKVVFERNAAKELITNKKSVDIQRRYLATSGGYYRERKLKKGQRCI